MHQKNSRILNKAIFIITGTLLLVFCCFHSGFARKSPFSYSVVVPENGLGGITGKITGDLQPAGKVVVVLMHKDKVVDKTLTDEEGFYKFRYVAEGDYDIKATKDGYRTCIVIQIPVQPDRVTKLDFYQPKINNDHMPEHPIVETYEYYHKYMKHPDVSYPR